MKKFLLTAALLAACGASYATNVIRFPIKGMSAAPVVPGKAPPVGALPGTVPGNPTEPEEPLVQGPKLVVAAELNFGNVAPGELVTRTLTMRNAGNEPVVFDDISVDNGKYSISSNKSTCARHVDLAPGGQCDLVLQLQGTGTVGRISDSLSIYTQDYGEYAWVALEAQGSGYPAPLVATTAPQGILGTFDGTATTGLGSYQYVYKNPTAHVLTITSLSVRGDSTGQTSATFSDNTCSGAVNPGASCSFTLNPNTAQPGLITIKFAETPLTTTTVYTLVGEYPTVTGTGGTVTGNTYHQTFINSNKIVPVDIADVSIQNSSYVDSSAHYKVTGCVNTQLLPGESCTLSIEYLPETGVQSGVSTGLYYYTQTNKTSRTLVYMRGTPWW